MFKKPFKHLWIWIQYVWISTLVRGTIYPMVSIANRILESCLAVGLDTLWFHLRGHYRMMRWCRPCFYYTQTRFLFLYVRIPFVVIIHNLLPGGHWGQISTIDGLFLSPGHFTSNLLLKLIWIFVRSKTGSRKRPCCQGLGQWDMNCSGHSVMGNHRTLVNISDRSHSGYWGPIPGRCVHVMVNVHNCQGKVKMQSSSGPQI